jgi:hypothetical protein
MERTPQTLSEYPESQSREVLALLVPPIEGPKDMACGGDDLQNDVHTVPTGPGGEWTCRTRGRESRAAAAANRPPSGPHGARANPIPLLQRIGIEANASQHHVSGHNRHNVSGDIVWNGSIAIDMTSPPIDARSTRPYAASSRDERTNFPPASNGENGGHRIKRKRESLPGGSGDAHGLTPWIGPLSATSYESMEQR